MVAFIEPPQADAIEKILKHCGLWCPASPRAPPTRVNPLFHQGFPAILTSVLGNQISYHSSA